MYQFQERVESQMEYYEQFKKWLKRRKNVIKVWDAELKEDIKGTDLFLKTTNEDVFRIQVKVDHKADFTGNLPFETVSQAYSNRNSIIGAEFNMADVHYIFFIFSHTKRILGYQFQPLLSYVIEHYKQFRNFCADNERYKTLGCLVPVEKVKHLVKFEGNLFESVEEKGGDRDAR